MLRTLAATATSTNRNQVNLHFIYGPLYQTKHHKAFFAETNQLSVEPYARSFLISDFTLFGVSQDFLSEPFSPETFIETVLCQDFFGTVQRASLEEINRTR